MAIFLWNCFIDFGYMGYTYNPLQQKSRMEVGVDSRAARHARRCPYVRAHLPHTARHVQCPH